MTDDVAELKTLDTPPFPIKYRHTMEHVPIVDESKSQVNVTDYQPVVALIKDLECHFAGTVTPLPIATHNSPKYVSFGSCAVRTGFAAHSDYHSNRHSLMNYDMTFYHDHHMETGLAE